MMSMIQFFNKIMCDHKWQRTQYPFWQNFFGSEFASSRYVNRFQPFVFLFLRSYLENIFHKDTIWSIAELKKKMENAIREIDSTLCWTVFADLLENSSSCLANKGIHFEYRDLNFFFLLLLKYMRPVAGYHTYSRKTKSREIRKNIIVGRLYRNQGFCWFW